MKTPGSLLLLLLLLTGLCIDGYKPVIIVHGILDGPKEFTTLASFINKVGRSQRGTRRGREKKVHILCCIRDNNLNHLTI